MIQTIDYYSWEDFKSQIANDLFDDSIFVRGRYLFRGHRNIDWSLTPTFDRMFAEFSSSERDKIEKKFIEEFGEEIDNLDLNIDLKSEESVLAFAQHHGLPTRLLDWSMSPYVAAFFAFADLLTSSNLSDESNVAIWVLDTEKDVWREKHGVMIVSPQRIGNLRLRNQQGKFTLSKTPFISLEEYVNYQKEPLALRKITIPAHELHKALSDLDLMGVNHSNLFTGADSAVRSTSMRIALYLLQLRK